MTAAVCLECGSMKTGAWTLCPGCKHLPQALEDKARHLITTDLYLKPQQLEAVSQQIKAGQAFQFVPEQVQAVVAELRRLGKDPQERQRLRSRQLRTLLVSLAVGGFVLSSLWLWWSSR